MSHFGSVPGLLTARSLIAEEWIFDAPGKSIRPVGPGKVVFVVNVTDGVVIFNPANPATTAVVLEDNYVELVFDTTSMSNDDELLVFCEVPASEDDTVEILRDILKEQQLHTKIFLAAFSQNKELL